MGAGDLTALQRAPPKAVRTHSWGEGRVGGGKGCRKWAGLPSTWSPLSKSCPGVIPWKSALTLGQSPHRCPDPGPDAPQTP